MTTVSVNWELAPKGTTHYMPENDDFYGSWVKKVGSFYFEIWYNGQWTTDSALDIYQDTFIIKPAEDRKVVWDGNGLPPVGTVCEIKHASLGWTQCEIVAHKTNDGGTKYAIAWIDSNTLDQSQGLRFRPIRTPEQIAEEERKAAYKGMLHDLAAVLGISNIDERECDVLHILVEAGYRKENKND